ncbi:hypothetical protein LWM68_24060 [Niabella sp. W65]|nr:hypothetical protein [Niabella sp. W65]MCH7365576.1 hypothetical protein [Niabella sp. W65]
MISSVTFLGYPAQGYTSNWILLVQGLMVPIVLLGCIWFIVPLFRKSIGLSTYEYFEKNLAALPVITALFHLLYGNLQAWVLYYS